MHSYMRAHVRTYYDGRNTNVTYARTHTLVRTYLRKALVFFADHYIRSRAGILAHGLAVRLCSWNAPVRLRHGPVRLCQWLVWSLKDSRYRACLPLLGAPASSLLRFCPLVFGQRHCFRRVLTDVELSPASCSAPLPSLFLAFASAPLWRSSLQMSVKPLDAARRSGVAPLGVAASSCARASNNASTT